MKHGIPFDVVWTWPEHMLLAAIVVIGESEGNEFDWTTRRWRQREQ